MLSKKPKVSERYSLESLEQGKVDSKGRLFFGPKGMEDLSNVKILHFGLDTIRQLYKGSLSHQRAGDLQAHLDSHLDTYVLNGEIFSLSKMGKLSGYRFKLQNNALGLVILVGSYYEKLEAPGAHLKIEVSPHLIAQRTTKGLTRYLGTFAKALMLDPEPSACALHIACDFQGWIPERQFVSSFVTRTRTIRQYLGIEGSEFQLAETATIYGDPESFTFGKANALQTSLYRKDLEATKRDKIDYWKATWGEEYDASLPVWRLEVRLHHTVVDQIGNGFGDCLQTAEDAEPYMAEIWHYCLTSNRYEAKRGHIAPVWQLLRDDAPGRDSTMPVKRVKKQSAHAVGRNIANALGNMVSMYARQRKTIRNLWTALKKLHIWDLIREYYLGRGITEGQLYQLLEKSLQERYLIGRAI